MMVRRCAHAQTPIVFFVFDGYTTAVTTPIYLHRAAQNDGDEVGGIVPDAFYCLQQVLTTLLYSLSIYAIKLVCTTLR